MYEISAWWLLLAVVAYMVIGSLWYSPMLFARPWLEALGKRRDDLKPNISIYVVPLVATVIIVLMLAYLIQATATADWASGALLGFKVWVGFVATTALINRVFQGSSMKLYIIDMGYHLVGLLVAGAILGH